MIIYFVAPENKLDSWEEIVWKRRLQCNEGFDSSATRVGKKMGYGNWNMWLLKLVWVARSNFACEVYVQPFSEKHVKRVNFYFKCKDFSQNWYLRSVDEQKFRIIYWGKNDAKCTAHDLSSLSDLELLCLAVTFLLYWTNMWVAEASWNIPFEIPLEKKSLHFQNKNWGEKFWILLKQTKQTM